MNLRRYNVYFHTHTISGILVAAVLYVMFFAGSFAFFKDEIAAWQNEASGKHQSYGNTVVFNALLDSLDEAHNLHGRDLSFTMQPNSYRAYVSLQPSKDTINNEQAAEQRFFNYDFHKKETGSYASSYDLGEFLYRLHFLAQLNEVPIQIGYPFGYVVAGLVSFLFLFALITGLLLHWDKLFSNFYTFRPWSKWKTIWTDAHTALGVIGFPYQFMFAVTGVMLIIGSVLVVPFSKVLYGGDESAVYRDLQFPYYLTPSYDFLSKPLASTPDVDHFVQRTHELWPNTFITSISINNYGDANMHILMTGEPATKWRFAGQGVVCYRVSDGKVIEHKSAEQAASYLDKVKSLVYRLHFGDYGGYPLKVVYFVLGLIGCVVIITGILIWLVARDKKNVPKHKRVFNFWASNIFVAACLTLFPVTAFSFIAVKVNGAGGMAFIYRTYFWSWLVLAVFYIARRNLRQTNKETLLLGSLLSLLVPVANGIYSGNWLWVTYRQGKADILLVDVLWLCLAVAGGIAFLKIKPLAATRGT